jgi:hypothetical protein
VKMVAVATLRDGAGAEVAREMLAERGITAEIKRLGYNPYFGAPTAAEYEVRVPEDAVGDAEAVLDGMAEELELAALAEAGVPPGDDDARGGDELPPPELRPRKVAWAVALGLVGPVPGCGLLYARAFALGWTMVGLSLALFVAAMGAKPDLFPILLALKAADIVVSPFAAARFNRSLKQAKEPHAAQS